MAGTPADHDPVAPRRRKQRAAAPIRAEFVSPPGRSSTRFGFRRTVFAKQISDETAESVHEQCLDLPLYSAAFRIAHK